MAIASLVSPVNIIIDGRQSKLASNYLTEECDRVVKQLEPI
ncbi:MAG: hypothetical protein QNJ53_23180 [Pleurocapsa sp. MO_192.B19]|nr:hypothetical protein [Pleurocapsa sp. MO_192.B19]